jgi:SNF2 family DNA or RNA helicase
MPIKVKPYQHQVDAFRFACEKFGLIQGKTKSSSGVALLMEMGTGKSLTGISISGALYLNGKISRVLVVCPLSITSVWQEEYGKFADFPYQVTILRGSSEKKRQQLAELSEGDFLQVVIVNYESAWRLEPELIRYNAGLIIADEGHKIKENRTAQSKCMHDLGARAPYKLLLTGTVISGKELDVFSQYKFLNPSIFGSSFYGFRNAFFYMGGYGNHIPIFKKAMTDTFLQKMHSVAFRVTKAECLDLPEITEEVRNIELEDKAMKIYEKLQTESFAELEKGEVSAVNVLTKLLRLSQLTGGFLTDDEGKISKVSSAKLSALEDIIDTSLSDGKKLVVIARFIPEMDEIEKMLQNKGIKYSCIRGGIKDRDEQIRSFQEDPETMVFLGQIQAAGLGITLTAASTMVFYSMDYSMANFDQAKARIHRVSQTENCHYIYLICKKTVDVRVLHALREKIDLAKSLVDDYRKGKNIFSA